VLASVLVASVAIACSGDLTVSMKAAGSSGTDDRPLVLVRALFFFFCFLLLLQRMFVLVLCCSNWFGDAGDSCF
jgi:hypothetical protein